MYVSLKSTRNVFTTLIFFRLTENILFIFNQATSDTNIYDQGKIKFQTLKYFTEDKRYQYLRQYSYSSDSVHTFQYTMILRQSGRSQGCTA